jgi:hypothetical protein
VRAMPAAIVIPGGGAGHAAQVTASRNEIVKAFTNACLRDAEQKPAFFAFIIDRISDYSKSVLKTRAGYATALDESDVFWAYQNLRATHETENVGVAPSRTLILKMKTEFDGIKQGKVEIATYKVDYERREAQLLAHGVALKPDGERAVHFLLSLNDRPYGTLKEHLRSMEALGRDEYPTTINAAYEAATAWAAARDNVKEISSNGDVFNTEVTDDIDDWDSVNIVTPGGKNNKKRKLPPPNAGNLNRTDRSRDMLPDHVWAALSPDCRREINTAKKAKVVTPAAKQTPQATKRFSPDEWKAMPRVL